ncbi:hypothetical protein [Dysgonomonas termitidis]|uniref:Uncharacterized protein n=1 Tax=Dysgonomonas termitidis TaxID=1516126 RepID=A0ABV9KPU6_9BACT
MKKNFFTKAVVIIATVYLIIIPSKIYGEENSGIREYPEASKEEKINENPPYSISDLHFKRIAATRNVYNMGLLMNELSLNYNIFEGNTNLYPKQAVRGNASLKHIGQEVKITNNSAQVSEDYIQIGNFYPYATYDLEFNGKSGKFIYKFGDDKNSLKLIFSISGKTLNISKVETLNKKEGQEIHLTAITDITDDSFNIRLQFSGAFGHDYQIYISTYYNGHTTYKYSVPLSINTTHIAEIENYKWHVGAETKTGQEIGINKAKCWYGNGFGQADPHPVNFEDGSPVIKDGKLFFSVSFRSADILGILSLNINTMEWKCEGIVLYELDGKICNYIASTIIYQRDKRIWSLFTPAHGGEHVIYYGESNKNPLFGLTHVRLSMLDYNEVKGDEDISVFYDKDADMWYAAYAKLINGHYSISLCKSGSVSGKYEEIANTGNEPFNVTGINIQKIGGKRYVLCGSDKGYLIFSFPKLEFLGKFNVDFEDGGYRGWGTVVPFPDGIGTKYLWLTFDRGKGNGGYNWSYGGLYLYRSAERNEGYEYPLTDF